jgi:hypothetical protein
MVCTGPEYRAEYSLERKTRKPYKCQMCHINGHLIRWVCGIYHTRQDFAVDLTIGSPSLQPKAL